MRDLIKNISYLFFCVINGFLRKEEISVLMYHPVNDSGWKLAVSRANFEKQMKYLVDNFNIVSLDNIVSYLKNEIELPNKTVALTFDDGYGDTYAEVFAVIKKYNIPITVFLTTDLRKKEKMKNLERLTWEQAKEMQASGLVKIEAHGHEHLDLTKIAGDEKKMDEEVEKSVDLIERHLNCRPKYYAYAYGAKNDEVVQYSQGKKFKAAFSITEGLIKKGDNLFEIKRVQVDKTMNFFLFKARLTGAVDLNRKFVDFARRIWKRK